MCSRFLYLKSYSSEYKLFLSPETPLVPFIHTVFPFQGVKLLSYLYKEALNNCSNEHYPVLLSLLKTSCEPYARYVGAASVFRCPIIEIAVGMSVSPCPKCKRNWIFFRFIHDWVYSGVFRDVYGEFMIQVNEDYLGFRGTSSIKLLYVPVTLLHNGRSIRPNCVLLFSKLSLQALKQYLSLSFLKGGRGAPMLLPVLWNERENNIVVRETAILLFTRAMRAF